MKHISELFAKPQSILNDHLINAVCRHGWRFADKQPDQHYLRFEQGEALLDIWPSTLTSRFISEPNAKAQHARHEGIVELQVTLEKLPI